MAASFSHEGIVEMFRHRPDLAAHLLRELLGAELPAYTEARIVSADLTELKPAEYRADLVVLLHAGVPVFGIVLEVQLGVDPRKLETWPLYGVAVRARHRCEVLVLVVTPFEDVAAWASRPIGLGGASTFQVMVLGPGAIPAVESNEAANEDRELAVLSALAHGRDPVHGPRVALAALAAVSGLPDEQAKLYWDLVRASLGEAARIALEELMSSGHYEYQSDFAKKYVAEGKAEGKAEAALRVLEARGLAITPEQRTRILSTTDLAELDRWLVRAISAASTDEIFAG